MGNYPRQEVMLELRRQIASGVLVAGQRLPTELALAQRFRVSRGTVRSALAELVGIGMVVHRHGVGCFVEGNVERAPKIRRITFLHPVNERLNDRIVGGMEERATELNCELCIRPLSYRPEEAADTVAALKKNQVSGIIFTPFIQPDYYGINSRILDTFESYALRYVVIDTPIASHCVIRGDFVGNDGYTAMRQTVKRLIADGHRVIGSIRVFAGVYSADQRIRGIFDQLSADGFAITPELHRVIENVPLPEQGRARIRELMMLPEPPSAVICSHDSIALNVLDELRRMGKIVPDEVSLCGFDDLYFAEPLGLSTVRQPYAEIGRRAVEVLLDSSSSRRQEFLPCELMIRESIRKR